MYARERSAEKLSKIIDLSPRVPQGFKGPPSTNVGVQFEVKTKRDRGAYWQSGQVYMSLHTGCHVESALHCFENGEAIDQISLERVIGSAVILDLTPVDERAIIDVEDLERGRKRLGERGETMKAARWLVEKRPKCIGCDFFEEPAARQPGWTADQFVVHRAILGAGIPLIEGLVHLKDLPPRCQFFAPFYHFAGIDSAPARTFAVIEDE